MRRKTPKIRRFSQAVRFLRVTRLLLWTIWVIYRERRRVLRAHEKGHHDVQPNTDVLINVLLAFRQTALQLGVLMIKLGQFLRSRADLLPEKALAVLASLQDEVPAEPFSHVVSVIETELGKPVEDIFSTLERKATAAASLGQVHKGVLASTGEVVAVKVPRRSGSCCMGNPSRSRRNAFLGRAVSALVGVSTGLAPEFDFIECATPYARKFLGLNVESLRQTTQQLLSQMVQAVSTLLRLPRSMERILTKLEAGQLEIRIAGEFDVGARAFRRRERTGDTFPFALALMFVASLAGAYFLDTAHDHLLALLSLGLGAILGVRLFFRW